MAGLQPRFGAGSRRAKAWVSNELAVIDGVPRLSGPSHRTRSLLACSPRLHTVQHSTRAGTPQLPKMSPFQGCEPARPYCTVHTYGFLHLPGTSSMFHPTRSHRAGTAYQYSPRSCTRQSIASQAVIPKSSHWFLPECACSLACVDSPRLGSTTQVRGCCPVTPVRACGFPPPVPAPTPARRVLSFLRYSFSPFTSFPLRFDYCLRVFFGDEIKLS